MHYCQNCAKRFMNQWNIEVREFELSDESPTPPLL